MDKYYRVKKDTALWKAGAIIANTSNGGCGYVPVEDIWHTMPHNDYLSASIIEHEANAEWFEKVYPDTVSGTLYRTKDQMLAAYSKAFK